jgi:hypothetical protein
MSFVFLEDTHASVHHFIYEILFTRSLESQEPTDLRCHRGSEPLHCAVHTVRRQEGVAVSVLAAWGFALHPWPSFVIHNA